MIKIISEFVTVLLIATTAAFASIMKKNEFRNSEANSNLVANNLKFHDLIGHHCLLPAETISEFVTDLLIIVYCLKKSFCLVGFLRCEAS